MPAPTPAQQVSDEVGKRGEADGAAVLERGLAEAACQHRLADAGRAAEQDVLPVSDEVEPQQRLDEGAVDRARVRPLEAIDRHHRVEVRGAGTAFEVLALTLAPFDRGELLDGLDRAEPAVHGVLEERPQSVGGGADWGP